MYGLLEPYTPVVACSKDLYTFRRSLIHMHTVVGMTEKSCMPAWYAHHVIIIQHDTKYRLHRLKCITKTLHLFEHTNGYCITTIFGDTLYPRQTMDTEPAK